MIKVFEYEVPDGMDMRSVEYGIKLAMDAMKKADRAAQATTYKTCKGCRHNVIVSGVQVCWRPFAERGGDVHTVKAITDDHARCEHYETKEK